MVKQTKRRFAAVRRRFGMPQAAALASALVLVSLQAGCEVVRDNRSFAHPQRPAGAWARECSVGLGSYKSVQTRDEARQDPALALAVAISGGGYRAANFGAGALLELEMLVSPARASRNALSEADYLSTVSGGGLAAGVYVSSLHDHLTFGNAAQAYSLAAALKLPDAAASQNVTCDPNLLVNLRREYVSSMVRLLNIRGILTGVSAGDTLEAALDDYILGYDWRKERPGVSENDASLKLSDMFVTAGDTRPVRLPYWVANTAAFANSAIVPFMPDHLKLYQVRGYTHRTEKIRFDPEGGETSDTFIDAMPLALGMSASLKFPGIPYTTLTSDFDKEFNPYLHLFDGGMADNHGVYTAWRLLRAESHPTVNRRAMIVIDAYPGTFAPFSLIGQPYSISGTAMRVAEGHLDSWRGRYREIMTALCAAPADQPTMKITPVFLSFDDLKDATFDSLRQCGLEDSSCLQTTGDLDGAPVTPFRLVRSIATMKLDLSQAEQNILFAAGRYAVRKNKAEIIEALWP